MAYENKRDNMIIAFRLAKQFEEQHVSLSLREFIKQIMVYTTVSEKTAQSYADGLFDGFCAVHGRTKTFMKLKMSKSNVVTD